MAFGFYAQLRRQRGLSGSLASNKAHRQLNVVPGTTTKAVVVAHGNNGDWRLLDLEFEDLRHSISSEECHGASLSVGGGEVDSDTSDGCGGSRPRHRWRSAALVKDQWGKKRSICPFGFMICTTPRRMQFLLYS